MTVAYWTVLVAFALPYLFTLLAKSQSSYNNRAPRVYLDRVEGWRQRAHWVQLNSFEAAPPFAAAVIIAHQLGADQGTLNGLAGLWVALRLAYGAAYLADIHWVRSLIWFGATGCTAGIFALAAFG